MILSFFDESERRATERMQAVATIARILPRKTPRG